MSEKVKSPIDVLHDEFVAAGGKLPSKEVAKKLMATWEDARAKKDAAEKAYEQAVHAERAAIAAIVRSKGKGTFDYKGMKLTPMGRITKDGSTVLTIRKEGEHDVPSFG